MVEDRMEEAGTAEASPANDQWLCWAVRCAERSRDYKLIRYGVAGEYR